VLCSAFPEGNLKEEEAISVLFSFSARLIIFHAAYNTESSQALSQYGLSYNIWEVLITYYVNILNKYYAAIKP
jgi:hypothetical protein